MYNSFFEPGVWNAGQISAISSQFSATGLCVPQSIVDLHPGVVPYRPCPRLKFTAEGTVEEGGEEVLGLAQLLPLHGTQTLDSLHQGREFLL